MAYEPVQKSFRQSSSKKKKSPIVPPLTQEPTQANSQLSQKVKPSTLPSKEEREAIKRKIFGNWSKPDEIQYKAPESVGAIGMPIQAKLTIGAPGDKYEQEADRVAAQVVKQINAPVASQPNQNLQREELSSSDELMMKPEIGNIQRKEEPQEDEELQMKPAVQLQASGGGMAATDELETAIQQARGGGQPLVDEVREPMEQAFGADFSGVKIHTDSQADQLNQATQARAFTTGQDVFFRQGEYNPGSRGGQELIAHELTHVVQQNGGTVHRTPLPYIQKAPKNKVLPYKTDFKTTTDFERTHVAKDSEEAEKKGGERPDGGEVLHYMKLNQISNIDKDYERKFAAHLNFDKPEQFNRPQPDVGENNYWTEGKYKIWEYDRKKGKVSEKEVKLCLGLINFHVNETARKVEIGIHHIQGVE